MSLCIRVYIAAHTHIHAYERTSTQLQSHTKTSPNEMYTSEWVYVFYSDIFIAWAHIDCSSFFIYSVHFSFHKLEKNPRFTVSNSLCVCVCMLLLLVFSFFFTSNNRKKILFNNTTFPYGSLHQSGSTAKIVYLAICVWYRFYNWRKYHLNKRHQRNKTEKQRLQNGMYFMMNLFVDFVVLLCVTTTLLLCLTTYIHAHAQTHT